MLDCIGTMDIAQVARHRCLITVSHFPPLSSTSGSQETQATEVVESF